jgi:hypothetical protein
VSTSRDKQKVTQATFFRGDENRYSICSVRASGLKSLVAIRACVGGKIVLCFWGSHREVFLSYFARLVTVWPQNCCFDFSRLAVLFFSLAVRFLR